MNYSTWDFEEILNDIQDNINRISNEVDIYKFSHEENVSTYNKLVTVFLNLKDIN